MTRIQDILRSLGITGNYKGFHHACYSIHLATDDDFRLEAVTKEIYMETAAHFGCKWTAVERNIRTVVTRAWQINPSFLRHMAGYHLDGPPTASEFIEIVSSYILHSFRSQP